MFLLHNNTQAMETCRPLMWRRWSTPLLWWWPGSSSLGSSWEALPPHWLTWTPSECSLKRNSMLSKSGKKKILVYMYTYMYITALHVSSIKYTAMLMYLQWSHLLKYGYLIWLQGYMKQQNLSSSVQGRVLNFFDYLWIRNKGTDPQVLLEDMPYCMQSEVSLATTESLIKQVHYNTEIHAVKVMEYCEPFCVTYACYGLWHCSRYMCVIICCVMYAANFLSSTVL